MLFDFLFLFLFCFRVLICGCSGGGLASCVCHRSSQEEERVDWRRKLLF
jgi:hypothetical protein